MSRHTQARHQQSDLQRAHAAWSAGAVGQARKLLERHLNRHSKDADALHLRGVVALREGDGGGAAAWLEKACGLEPGNADILCDYGTALHVLGQRDRAQQAYLQALNVRPDHLDAVFNLANVLRETKQLQQALQFYSALLERNPNYRYAWNNTGLALLELSHFEQARRCFERELELDPDNAGACANLGLVLRELGQLEAAVEVYRRGLAIDPRSPEVHLNLGNALVAQSRATQAIPHLREAVRLRPSYDAAHQSLVFALDFDADASVQTQQEARRDWYRQCVAPLGIRPAPCFRPPDPERRLRVGYVSADFRHTSAAICFLPVLEHFDPAQFEVFCYANAVLGDALTERIQAMVTRFQVISGLTDAQAAALIASDRIDILVDLSGHMRGNRLGIFAHRPAPVQLTAWGYVNGTGMPEMDFVLADPVYLPDSDLPHFNEQRLDVPSVIPYEPPLQLPELPQSRGGILRFGAFTRWQKITPVTVALWSEVLKAVPDSELVLKASQEVDAAGVQAMRERFEQQGVAGHRIAVLPRSGWLEHLSSFGEIDIQLDPLPHGGGISLLDGLAMGVPSITLMGDTLPGRLGAALLTAVGLGTDWVADSTDAYVRLAQRWSLALAQVRAGRAALRSRLLNSPVGDAKQYASAVHLAYRKAWRARCADLKRSLDTAIDQVRAALTRGDASPLRDCIAALHRGCPEDPEVLDLACVAAMQSNQLDEALKLAQTVTTIAPQRAGSWTNLGAILAQMKRYKEAERALRQATELAPHDATVHYNLGCTHLSAGQDSQARADFAEAVRLQPDHALAYNNLGILHDRSGQGEQAEACFRKAIGLNPRLAVAFGNLGKICVDRRDTDEGLANFEIALQLDASLHWVRFELAVWYERMGYGHRQAALCQPQFRAAKTGTGGRCDPKIFDRIIALIRDEYARNGSPPGALKEIYYLIASRLMEIDHPAKNVLFDRIIAMDADDLQSYIQAGISLHHDGRYRDAARRWDEGLARRDSAATRAGVVDAPHRLMDTSWCMALGHLQLFDIYQKSVELGLRPRRDLWLLRAARQKIPNETYLGYWKHLVHVDCPVEDLDNTQAISRASGVNCADLRLIRDDFFADRIPGVHSLWHMEFAARIQQQWEEQGGRPLLQLTPEDRTYGANILAQLGVPPDAWYVCLHVREPGFWSKWDRYHPSLRNAHIDAYQKTIDHVIERGGWVIRMGDKSMRPLPPRDRVVDYAHHPLKSDRMDVFLFGSARLFIGVNSGAALIPPTFGIPCLLTNFVPITVPFPYGQDRMLPKLFRKKGNGTILRISEMLATGVANAQFTGHIPADLEALDNDPDDIAQATAEMLDELEGCLPSVRLTEFQMLRQRYDAVLTSHGNFTGSPPAGVFLRRYAHLLES